MINFLEPHYLKRGNRRQREVYAVISVLRLMSVLKPYTPVMAGTIPIGVDIESSDIDILCSFDDAGDFQHTLSTAFSMQHGFSFKRTSLRQRTSLIASFLHKGYRIEIFGQMIPAYEQDGFVHMVVEYRILQMCNGAFREKVRELKRSGLGTEPAFARLLDINDDPYEALLGFRGLDDNELIARIPEQHRRGK